MKPIYKARITGTKNNIEVSLTITEPDIQDGVRTIYALEDLGYTFKDKAMLLLLDAWATESAFKKQAG